jgi:LPXTG-motif cell wall-anchored protein
MRSKALLFAGLFLAVTFAAMPASLVADEFNQATELTFNEPVEVPGHVLAAGTYWFTLLDNGGDRNIVQIQNADKSKVVATILSIADYRLKPIGKTVINFEERPGDQPEAIQAWFYPGDNFGHEFVYPKTRAIALAQQIHQPVLSMPDQAVNDPAPSSPAMKAVTANGEEIEVSEIVQSEQPEDNVVLASLPQTASSLPLTALLGLLALGASFYFRRVAHNIA